MMEPTREPDDETQDEARSSRDTGGDGPAAGTIEEREALARGEGPFDDDGED